MQTTEKLAGILCIVLLISSLIYYVTSSLTFLGERVTLFFVSLALAVRRKENLKGFSFTILIFAAVAASMFFPAYFTQVGSFNLNQLIVPILIIIMFGMGTSISLSDFYGVIKMPKGVLLGVLRQFTIMPIIGASLAYVSDLPPEIAAGIILVGCYPMLLS